LNVIWNSISNEIFEKCSILFKVKLPARRAYRPEGKARILAIPIDRAGQASIH